MEELEKIVEKVEPRLEETRPVLVEESVYVGFRKIEDKPYTGGTSIRYWM